MNLNARLEALKNAPKPYRVTMHFEDGNVEHLDQPFEASWVAAEKRCREMIGKKVRGQDITRGYVKLIDVTTSKKA